MMPEIRPDVQSADRNDQESGTLLPATDCGSLGAAPQHRVPFITDVAYANANFPRLADQLAARGYRVASGDLEPSSELKPSHTNSHLAFLGIHRGIEAEWSVLDDAKRGEARPSRWFGTYEKATRRFEVSQAKGGGAYYMPNLTDGKGQKAENVIGTRDVLVADIDGKGYDTDEAHQAAFNRALDRRPHYIMRSSFSKDNGRASYWFFYKVRELPLARFVQAEKRLAHHIGCDASIATVERLARLSGWRHQKGEPITSVGIAWGEHDPYDLDDFLAGLDWIQEEPRRERAGGNTEPPPIAPGATLLQKLDAYVQHRIRERGISDGKRDNELWDMLVALRTRGGAPLWAMEHAEATYRRELNFFENEGTEPARRAHDRNEPLPGADLEAYLDRTLRLATEAAAIAGMNERYAYIFEQNKALLLSSLSDPRSMLAYRTVDAIQNYEGEFVTIGDKPKPVAPLWLRSARKLKYDGVVFRPGQKVPADKLNLFTGWTIEPKAGDWSLLRNHMLHKLCHGNPVWFHWLMAWGADIFQHPSDKMPSAIAIRGKKGTGKTTPFEMKHRLLGRHAIEVGHMGDIIGTHNGHLAAKLLLIADDAVWGGYKQAEGKLKGLISSKRITINDKFVTAVELDNHMRLAMTTNDTWVVQATDDERRYFVLQAQDGEHRNNRAYWVPLYRQMEEEGGLAAMLYELLHYEYDREILRDPPKTPWLAEQVELSLTGPAKMFSRLLSQGYLPADERLDLKRIELSDDGATTVYLEHLKRHYEKAYARDRIDSPVAFGKEAVAWLCPVDVRPGRTGGRPSQKYTVPARSVIVAQRRAEGLFAPELLGAPVPEAERPF